MGNWRPPISAFGLVIIVVVFARAPISAHGQVPPPPVDLNGSWKYMDGAAVNITHDRRSRKVTAKFDKPYPCTSGYATLDTLFEGQLEGTQLKGNWKSCNDKLLVDACAKEPTYQGDFTASVSYSEMSGEYRLPYFTWTGACEGLKQSTTVSPYLPLSLTREMQPPEDKKPDCRNIACYCGSGPDKGFVFYNGPGGPHSEPSNNAPVVGQLPRGGRLVYHATTRSLTGDLWFGVAPPGIQGGGDPELREPRIVWVPASALSCKRPSMPLPPKPSGTPDPNTRDKLAKPGGCNNRYDPFRQNSCTSLQGAGGRG